MLNQPRDFDWQIFWMWELAFLSIPLLIAVVTVPRHDYMHHAKLTVVLSVQLGLTILNVLWTLASSRSREHLHR